MARRSLGQIVLYIFLLSIKNKPHYKSESCDSVNVVHDTPYSLRRELLYRLSVVIILGYIHAVISLGISYLKYPPLYNQPLRYYPRYIRYTPCILLTIKNSPSQTFVIQLKRLSSLYVPCVS